MGICLTFPGEFLEFMGVNNGEFHGIHRIYHGNFGLWHTPTGGQKARMGGINQGTYAPFIWVSLKMGSPKACHVPLEMMIDDKQKFLVLLYFQTGRVGFLSFLSYPRLIKHCNNKSPIDESPIRPSIGIVNCHV